MDHSPSTINQQPYSAPPSGRRAGWIDAAIASGFIATIAMTICLAIAYGIANAFGNANGQTLEQWLAALSQNELTENVNDSFALGLVFNLIMGLVWAIVYAYAFASRLPGPGWFRGVLFSLIPWLLSIVVFFPLTGIGFLGNDIDAGFLPALGNLILHLVFGAVLGTLYRAQMGYEAGDDTPEFHMSRNSARASSLGILIGGTIGFIGGWFLGPSIDNIASQPMVAFAGCLIGAAMGMAMGALFGMGSEEPATNS